MVGHTNETIDQMFSRFSDKLNHNNAPTLPKLHQILSEAFFPSPTVEHLYSIFNYKEQYVGLRKLTGVKSPHLFRFKLDQDGTIQLAVKDWPLQEEPYRVESITVVPDLQANLNAVEPRLLKIRTVAAAVQRDLDSFKKSGRLTEEDITWWHLYLEKLQADRRPRPLTPSMVTLPVYDINPTTTESVLSSTLREALNQSIVRLQSVSEVRLGRQRITL